MEDGEPYRKVLQLPPGLSREEVYSLLDEIFGLLTKPAKPQTLREAIQEDWDW
jgi:hypothetical protein